MIASKRSCLRMRWRRPLVCVRNGAFAADSVLRFDCSSLFCFGNTYDFFVVLSFYTSEVTNDCIEMLLLAYAMASAACLCSKRCVRNRLECCISTILLSCQSIPRILNTKTVSTTKPFTLSLI